MEVPAAKPKLAALLEHPAQLSKQIGEIAEATPITWDSVKAETQKASIAVKDAVIARVSGSAKRYSLFSGW